MISLLLNSKNTKALKSGIKYALDRFEDDLKYEMPEEQRSKIESTRDRLNNILAEIYNKEARK